MRLSRNWLVRNIALGFIELVRNTPQLRADRLLVRRGAADAAVAAPEHRAAGGRPAEHPRPLSAERRCSAPHGRALAAARAARRCWRRRFVWRRRRQRACRSAPRALLAAACGGCAVRRRHRAASSCPACTGFNIAGGVAGAAGTGRALGGPVASTPPPSSPRSCAPRSCRCTRGQREAALSLGLTPRPGAAPRSSCRRRCG